MIAGQSSGPTPTEVDEARASLARMNATVRAMEGLNPLMAHALLARLGSSKALNASEITTVRALAGIRGL